MFKYENPMRLVGRRELLLKTAGMVSLVGLGGMIRRTAVAQTSNSIVLTPQEEEGPYFVDEKLNRSDIIVDPSDGSVQPGLPMMLSISVSQVSNGAAIPLRGAYVDIWQASAYGVYSDESSEGTVGKKYLRGYQVTGSNGMVEFLTIYPGWYSGRTAHIHCRVRLFTGSTATYSFETQFFMDDAITQSVYQTIAPYNTRVNARDTYNETDRVYNFEDCTTGVTSGKEMMLRLTADSNHAVASYSLQLDLSAVNDTGCIGVTDGGINEGNPGGGTPPPGAGTPPPGGGTPPPGGGGPPPRF